MQTMLKRFGISYFTLYEFTGSTEKGLLGNYPKEWGERYAERRYEYRDPVAQKLFERREGFFWDARRFESDGKLKGYNGRVFYEGAEFGLEEGYARLMFCRRLVAAVKSEKGNLKSSPMH